MFEYLQDKEFLEELDRLRVRTQIAKITTLDFSTEQPLLEIQGTITSGSITVNKSSSIRRTINLSMFCSLESANIENLDNQIAIDKKIKVEIGYKNPLKEYAKYGEIVWFPCGIFIIGSANTSRGVSGWTLSVTGKDKMVQLNGEVGGTLVATTVFHEKYEQKENGDIDVTYPTIRQIIEEAVHHLGGEPLHNIIISDLDEEARIMIKYLGNQAIYFNDEYTSLSYAYNKEDYPNMKVYNDNIGYEVTPFTYPGELVFNAGQTVEMVLKKICETLTNFEYFYDLDGRFIFQEIKNYLNITNDLTKLTSQDYLRFYNSEKNATAKFALTDKENVVSINRTPKYDNLKNDFIVWGKRTLPSGVERNIHYRLVIDEKPLLYYAKQYMFKGPNGYRFSFDETKEEEEELIGLPCGEWREELYRQALAGDGSGPYDAELLAEWRDLYDTIKWQDVEVSDSSLRYWNPDVYLHPETINFWLDFIGGDAQIQEYSVNRVGRRTKVVNNNNAKVIYNASVPDIFFVPTVEEAKKIKESGRKAFVVQPNLALYLAHGGQAASCYDEIRNLLYQNLNYNTTINITCLPKYYLEPNNIIYIEDKESGIIGNYLITQFTVPLSYSGTMSITATEVLNRV